MMHLFKTTILLISILFSCADVPKDLSEFMVDVKEFNMDQTVLKDGDYVEILGSSGNLTAEHEIDFYNLVVVKSEKTGDTINVLVTNFYQSDISEPITRFISNSSTVGKLLENVADAEEFNGKNIDDLQSKAYDKVFYDSEYILVDVRKYKTVTGNLGDYTIEGNLEDLDW